ncbi:GNAT family N-acetyltransferase [Sinorhizobium terangae]|uniref:GNAT family N-acetyltransferase n=1 Tax=Sinorhizobium terangae TaxID=110322 RepID=A0A6N7LDJ7_SINTE|nr:GNAT family N-acetyltransferase [Sinorhizobium terangae]MBB4188309.1 GNAT superfamily N-acetyltransferase [Sinorhizobium terangae]MQX15340.1 GNAT family N-acetyltransferase [Sinorhizobium terangae]WFU49709.1 GNAT family N-acetyltransferase [Sinorhizobium terangae]
MADMHVTIRTAVSADDYAAFDTLIREYTDWCRARYAHDRWFVDAAFGHQSLDAELMNLPAVYGPPNGKTLLATIGNQIHGACAYRRLSDGICEMKRLFVPARSQGHGIGRRLGDAIMAAASADGYMLMRLDTANRLTEAIALYKSLGFRDCPPYHQYPDDLMPHIVFMERELGTTPSTSD